MSDEVKAVRGRPASGKPEQEKVAPADPCAGCNLKKYSHACKSCVVKKG